MKDINSIIQKYSLDKSTWTHKGFHGVLHTFFPVGMTGFPMKEIYGYSNNITLFFVTENYVHWYWNDNDLERIRNLFLENLRNNPKYLDELIESWRKKLINFDNVISKVQNTDLSKISDFELTELYKVFYDSYLDEFTYFMALGDAISMHADRYLIPIFNKILGKDFNVIFPKLVTTKHLSFIEQEEIDRQRIIEKYLKQGIEIPEQVLEEHSNKYFYIQNNYAKAIYLSQNDFKKIIYSDFENNSLSQNEINKAEELKEKNELLEKYNIAGWNKILLDVLDAFFEIQDTRKKYVLISNYYQFRFLEEVSRRTKISLDLLSYSIYPEFKILLSGQIETNVLSERKKMCLCILTSDGYEIITGDEASEMLNFFMNRETKNQELKGNIASAGNYKGKVKIILKVHDLMNVEEGDVLVTSMTRPEMIVVMKKAGAIITDEGGLTSHAAIVSRELGIPCIIGTKIATQVLKDGDMVEVDANNGIVRKI